MKLDFSGRIRKTWPLVLIMLILASTAFANEQTKDSIFRYAGGSEKIDIDCAGKLEVTVEGLFFKCPSGSVDIPFATITLMQFRPDVSQSVRKLKLKWTTYPNILIAGKENRYFTIVYKNKGETHVVVLRVDAVSMRPYLAEIELKSGKRVEVMPYADYS